MNFSYRTFGSMNSHVSDTENIAPVCLVVENSKDTAMIPLYCFDNTIQAIANGFKLYNRMINGFLVTLNTSRGKSNPDTRDIYACFDNGTGMMRFKYKEGEYIVGPGLLYDMMEQKLLVLACKNVLFRKTDGIINPTVTEVSFFIDPSFFSFGNHPMRKKIINQLSDAAYNYKIYVRHLDNLSTNMIHNKPLCQKQQDKIRNRSKALASNVLENLMLYIS